MLLSYGLKASKIAAIWIARLFILARRIEDFLALKLIEQYAVNSHGFCLWYSAHPNGFERRIQQFSASPRIHFIDECDILAWRKYNAELFVRRLEDVVNTVHCAVNDLNILHQSQHP